MDVGEAGFTPLQQVSLASLAMFVFIYSIICEKNNSEY